MYDQLNQAILTDAEWIFDRLANAENDTDRAYYQGQIDAMAQVRRQMVRIMKVGA